MASAPCSAKSGHPVRALHCRRHVIGAGSSGAASPDGTDAGGAGAGGSESADGGAGDGGVRSSGSRGGSLATDSAPCTLGQI